MRTLIEEAIAKPGSVKSEVIEVFNQIKIFLGILKPRPISADKQSNANKQSTVLPVGKFNDNLKRPFTATYTFKGVNELIARLIANGEHDTDSIKYDIEGDGNNVWSCWQESNLIEDLINEHIGDIQENLSQQLHTFFTASMKEGGNVDHSQDEDKEEEMCNNNAIKPNLK